MYLLTSCSESTQLNSEEKSWLELQDSITVSVFPYYAPYQFKNKAGEIDGIFVDYLELIEEKLDYKFHRRQYDYWPDVLKDAKSGQLDIVLEIQQTDSRKKYLKFYDLYFESQQSLVTQKSKTHGGRLQDYLDHTITLPVGYAITENLRDDYPNLKIFTELNDSVCLTKLNQGKYDAYIGPRAVVNHFKQTERLNNIKIVGDLPYLYAPDIGVNKNNAMLNQIFSKAANSISTEERLKIQDSWLFNEVKPFYRTTAFYTTIAAGIIALLLVTVLLNRYLKYMVRIKTEQLKISKDLASKSNELRKQFIKNMSHEIRTPLNAIVGFSTLLKNNKAQKTDYIDEIKDGALRLEHILKNISKISLLQTQQITVKNKAVNIENMLINLVEDFEMRAREHNIELSLNSRQQPVNKFIEIDGDKLKQALTIILGRAIEFTDSKAIDIEYEYEQQLLEILIKGTSIGKKALGDDFNFESFTELQKKISQRQHSIGLALTIAREHIVLLDGTIDYSATKDGNSVFVINIPFKEA